jgi:hypothetical protein
LALVAVIVNVYVVAAFNPLTVIGELEPLPDPPDGLEVIENDVAVAPIADGVKETVVTELDIVALPIIGAVGTATDVCPLLALKLFTKLESLNNLLIAIEPYYLQSIFTNYTIILTLQTSQTLIY